MHRRTFLQMAAAAPAALAAPDRKLPKYRVVSHYQPAAQPGMPGPYPGQVASVHAANCIDEATEKPDPALSREMVARAPGQPGAVPRGGPSGPPPHLHGGGPKKPGPPGPAEDGGGQGRDPAFRW